MNNPFDITKAVDFTDQQIGDYWQDIPNDGFENFLKPSSLMSMIILGSKGCGKTHMMRYFSYELQKIKFSKNLKEGFKKEKFIGIYLRCSGLNSDKFSGRGISNEEWEAVYSYYWELWVAQKILRIIKDLSLENVIKIKSEKEFILKILSLFNKAMNISSLNLDETINLFEKLQREIDYEVENCIFRKEKKLNINILISPAKITYNLPDIIKDEIPFFKDKIFLYLIDELENFSLTQQRLVQTLIREKSTSCSFRIGARLYGILTYETLGGKELNREGSEFEKVVLDEFLRNNKNYSNFIREMCNCRLVHAGFHRIKMDTLLKPLDLNAFCKDCRYKEDDIVSRFRRKLSSNKLFNKDSIDYIVKNLEAENILIQRTNYLLFYRYLKKKKTLSELNEYSLELHKTTNDYLKNGTSTSNQISKVIKKFKHDIIASLARETNKPIPYYGFDHFIAMSSGTPRNILNLLKYSYKWEYFKKGNISSSELVFDLNSQSKGIIDTYKWFFEDNRIPYFENGKPVDCIERIGTLLQGLRFSDIPPECEISIFSVKLNDFSDKAREILNFLKNYSYIIEETPRRDKNTNEKRNTYRINPIILPKWELSVNKRGVRKFSKEEINNIFDLSELSEDKFRNMLKQTLIKYNIPFGNNESIKQKPVTVKPKLIPDTKNQLSLDLYNDE